MQKSWGWDGLPAGILRTHYIKFMFSSPIPVDCINTTCSNAESCIQEVTEEITCMCEEGWTGINCSENINDCTESSCSNGGSCEDELNGFNCSCPPAWTGAICEEGKLFFPQLYMGKCPVIQL